MSIMHSTKNFAEIKYLEKFLYKASLKKQGRNIIGNKSNISENNLSSKNLVYKRTNKNFLISWWSAIDRVILTSIAIIIAFSAIMVATASPAVADRIGVESYYFIKRHFIFLVMSLSIIMIFSFISSRMIKLMSLVFFTIFIILMIAVLFYGHEIKGAKRWLSIASISLQPSEFVKPFFVVITGWILSKKYFTGDFPAFKLAIVLYLLVVLLLFLQPDFGMIVTISCVWGGQLFLAGLSISWILLLVILGIVGVVLAYLLLPHVALRINNFLDPSTSDNYQVKKSLAAFINGGMFGRGPGEGIVKQSLPDSHTDFIFAVIGEELGSITCILIICIFLLIIIRGLVKVSTENDLFSAYSVAGLLMLFGTQALINIGVTVHLLPTKGTTLPFISYGGSSIVAVSITMGIILALTKKKFGYKYLLNKYQRKF